MNVYLPYQCEENIDDYMLYLGKLSSIINQCNTPYICIVGDFNAKINSKFEHELLTFVKSDKLHISDYEFFGTNSGVFTYVSDSHCTTSWLDHHVCSYTMNAAIDDMTVLDKLPSSDHLPITAIFKLPANKVSAPCKHTRNMQMSMYVWK